MQENKKKSIFYYTPYFFPDNNAGVIRNNSFIRELEKDFILYTLTSTKNSIINNTFLNNPSNKDGFKKRLLKEVLCGFELMLKIILTRKDYYFFSSPTYITVFMGAFICALTGKKYILDIRDIYPEVFVTAGLIKTNNPIYIIAKKWTNFIYNKAQLIFAATEGLKNQISSMTCSKVELIRNGYDPELFKQISKTDTFSCVFHGTLGMFQDIELLAKVIQETLNKENEIEFIVVGDGPNSFPLDKIHDTRFKWIKKLEYQSIPAEVGKHHLGLSFRVDNDITRDAFPVKVYEYIGLEVPTLSTPLNCEVAGFINNLNIGKNFSNNSAREISEYIIELKNNRQRLSELSHNISKIKDQFTRESQAKKLNEKISRL